MGKHNRWYPFFMAGSWDLETTESLKTLFLVFMPKLLKFNYGKTLFTAELDLYSLFEICSSVSRLKSGCFEKIHKYWVWNFESLCIWFLFQGEETPRQSSATVTRSMKKSQIQKFIAEFVTTNIFLPPLYSETTSCYYPNINFEFPRGGKL